MAKYVDKKRNGQQLPVMLTVRHGSSKEGGLDVETGKFHRISLASAFRDRPRAMIALPRQDGGDGQLPLIDNT